jgi:hypothetical protein
MSPKDEVEDMARTLTRYGLLGYKLKSTVVQSDHVIYTLEMIMGDTCDED